MGRRTTHHISGRGLRGRSGPLAKPVRASIAAAGRPQKKVGALKPPAGKADLGDVQRELAAAKARVAQLEARLAEVTDRIAWVADRLHSLIEDGG